MRYVLTFLLLAAVWFLWSGHTEPLMLAFGAVSCTVVILVCHRLRILDEEAFPFRMAPRLLAFIPWIMWEIVRANIAVARTILSPRMHINPQLIRLPISQKTTIGRVTHANAITITPGTITIDVKDHELVVHALTDEAAAEDAASSLDQRVSRIEGTLKERA